MASWAAGDPVFADRVTIVGYPIELNTTAQPAASKSSQARFTRQSFLGPYAQNAIENVALGIVGLGGGGSHIVQQSAHLGFRHFRVFDDDAVDATNLNRLVGSWQIDALGETLQRLCVARRVIRARTPDAEVLVVPKRWQECPESLRGCDLVFGCVDTFSERQQLEAFCRRFLIPYVDIGMDVHQVIGELAKAGGTSNTLNTLVALACFVSAFLTEEFAGSRSSPIWRRRR